MTRKTSFLIPHHTCYPVTEDKGVIYQYLDENKSLILKIVESQNTGKLSECVKCCFARAPMKKAFRFDVFDVNV
ncbi:hypothetical protein L3X38_024619 [Prunus dulcis]|uniref:SS18 N-terminal domain-containing protein n=1 Tax=Prunus dulcis TaxID=3755 RepID=A0AAD4W2N6_PRUDU|nr:hypothetical protein L3X38_024619 [Prunus dulcis]